MATLAEQIIEATPERIKQGGLPQGGGVTAQRETRQPCHSGHLAGHLPGHGRRPHTLPPRRCVPVTSQCVGPPEAPPTLLCRVGGVLNASANGKMERELPS
ncbi:hypothetical protein INR49_022821 [Caranx melampygus]|nr:hypothetical protein INR49_022821 [Caranx melampygus]